MTLKAKKRTPSLKVAAGLMVAARLEIVARLKVAARLKVTARLRGTTTLISNRVRLINLLSPPKTKTEIEVPAPKRFFWFQLSHDGRSSALDHF